jgi:hypothetical protein
MGCGGWLSSATTAQAGVQRGCKAPYPRCLCPASRPPLCPSPAPIAGWRPREGRTPSSAQLGHRHRHLRRAAGALAQASDVVGRRLRRGRAAAAWAAWAARAGGCDMGGRRGRHTGGAGGGPSWGACLGARRGYARRRRLSLLFCSAAEGLFSRSRLGMLTTALRMRLFAHTCAALAWWSALALGSPALSSRPFFSWGRAFFACSCRALSLSLAASSRRPGPGPGAPLSFPGLPRVQERPLLARRRVPLQPRRRSRSAGGPDGRLRRRGRRRPPPR